MGWIVHATKSICEPKRFDKTSDNHRKNERDSADSSNASFIDRSGLQAGNQCRHPIIKSALFSAHVTPAIMLLLH